jgi:hypothetical protein
MIVARSGVVVSGDYKAKLIRVRHPTQFKSITYAIYPEISTAAMIIISIVKILIIAPEIMGAAPRWCLASVEKFRPKTWRL